jgi:hypothetical protein
MDPSSYIPKIQDWQAQSPWPEAEINGDQGIHFPTHSLQGQHSANHCVE